MSHLTHENAEQYLQNEIGALKKFNITRHLKSCPACTELLKNTKENLRFLKEVKDAVDDQQQHTPTPLEKDTLLRLQNELESASR